MPGRVLPTTHTVLNQVRKPRLREGKGLAIGTQPGKAQVVPGVGRHPYSSPGRGLTLGLCRPPCCSPGPGAQSPHGGRSREW